MDFIPEKLRTPYALRNFFASENMLSMAETAAELNSIFKGRKKLTDNVNWQEAEYEFNRLFIGPDEPKAPLFASVYLDPDGLVMRDTTIEVRELYQSLSLNFPEAGNIPDDHLTLEIEACIYLRQLVDSNENYAFAEQYLSFLENHMKIWLANFENRVRVNTNLSLFIDICEILSEWINNEIVYLKGSTIQT